MASLKDIARSLSVSTSLVSKVLNNNLGTTGVRKDLAEAIKRRAEELGFEKNLTAVSLVKARQNTIAVFLHPDGNPGSGYLEDMLHAITAGLFEKRQKLHLQMYTEDVELEFIMAKMHRGIADGLILAGITHQAMKAQIREKLFNGVKVLTVFKEPLNSKVPNIGIDEELVGGIAARHLLEQGCQRLLVITAVKNGVRASGFLNAVQKAGIPPEDVPVVQAKGYEIQDGVNSMSAFLKQRQPAVDGIFADSDELAAGAMNVLIDRGVRIPEQVKIVGVDNSPLCRCLPVPLTSISLNVRERYEVAIKAMIGLTHGKRAQSQTILPTLFPRQSTAAAAIN